MLLAKGNYVVVKPIKDEEVNVSGVSYMYRDSKEKVKRGVVFSISPDVTGRGIDLDDIVLFPDESFYKVTEDEEEFFILPFNAIIASSEKN